MPKKAAVRDHSTWTKITPFRFKAETLADVDLVAADLTERTGVEHSRADAIRVVIREQAKKIRKKSSN